jgi:SNW domain-containing protein 1
MLNKYDINSGESHAHNFENTYLDDESLKKPSKRMS